MAGETVRVIIDKKGDVQVKMDGFHGVGCGAIAEKLAQNGIVTHEENTAEFYETNTSENTVTQS